MDLQSGYSTGKIEHRRSERFAVVLDAEVKWRSAEGTRFRQMAQVAIVNAHGGLLRMRTRPNVGQIIELTNVVASKSVRARVATMCGATPDGLESVGVELLEPNASFWAMKFELLSPF